MENITTPRLIIRRFVETDVDDYLDYQTRPETNRYLPFEPKNAEQGASFIAKQMALTEGEQGHYHAFAVEHRNYAKVIGDVGLFLEVGPENKGDLGFQFHPDYHGQGYAREATEAFIRYGFLTLNLRRITAGCDARNTASFGLMERLGMRCEAHFIQSRITKGVLHDEYAYALLRDEWFAPQELGVG